MGVYRGCRSAHCQRALCSPRWFRRPIVRATCEKVQCKARYHHLRITSELCAENAPKPAPPSCGVVFLPLGYSFQKNRYAARDSAHPSAVLGLSVRIRRGSASVCGASRLARLPI